MRILEVLLILAELVVLLSLWQKSLWKSKNARRSLFLLVLVLFFLHGFIEGIRWQMAPAYATIALTPLAFVPAAIRLPRYLIIVLLSMGILSVIISLLLGCLLPIFRLPEPSGPFMVGTAYLHLQDSTRPEIITLDTTDVRELMVRVWYPAEPESQETYPYMHSQLANVLAKNHGLPGFIMSHFSLIETHSILDAKVASGERSFPAVIFSPGYMSHSSMYTSLLETLASHGYIVFSIDYTYETPLSIFSDDDLRLFDPVYTDVWRNVSWDSVEASIHAFEEAVSVATQRQYVSQYLARVPYTARVDNWSEDVVFVIDQLHSEEQRVGESLFNRVDLNSIGVMGHSMGGATSAVACVTDRRVKAGINLDGSQWGSLMNDTITQPFLWITAEQDPAAPSMTLDSFIYDQVSEGSFHHLSVARATHTNFSDMSFWSNYPPLTQIGSIDGRKMIRIINQCSLNFFGKHLKKKPVTIDSVAEEFGELTIKHSRPML